MAMILTTTLILYAVVTLPFIAVVAYRVWKSLYSQKASRSYGVSSMIMEAKVAILDEIRKLQNTTNAWLPAVDIDIKELRKDSKAALMALQAMTKAMSEIKITAETFTKDAEQNLNINRFIQQLEYARDRYTKNPTQKKAIQGIISNVITTHGTSTK